MLSRSRSLSASRVRKAPGSGLALPGEAVTITWTNLTMQKQEFDTVVVGSGTAAYFCITALNKAGQQVAVVDERPYGGTCALRGCQPKKYLVANAEAVAMASELEGIGLTEAPKNDWPALQKLKNDFLNGIPEGEVDEFKAAGIATFAGKAQLVGPNEVAVGDPMSLN